MLSLGSIARPFVSGAASAAEDANIAPAPRAREMTIFLMTQLLRVLMRTNSANCRMFPDRDLAERGGLRSPPGWGRLPTPRLVAATLLARDPAAVPFIRSSLHSAALSWADGDTTWADA